MLHIDTSQSIILLNFRLIQKLGLETGFGSCKTYMPPPSPICTCENVYTTNQSTKVIKGRSKKSRVLLLHYILFHLFLMANRTSIT
jgi:hypothetical protein